MTVTDEAGPRTAPAEVPPHLEGAQQPRVLSFADQFSLWANLGVSVALPLSAGLILAPNGVRLPLGAAVLALVIGTLLGNALLGATAVPSVHTGASSMVLQRGLLGRAGSVLPTLLNVLQLIGWTTVEIVVVAETARGLAGDISRWVLVLAAGAVTIIMTLRPIALIKGYLRKIAIWLVLASTLYLFVRVLGQPLGSWSAGSWSEFWPGADMATALAVTWVPLVGDYARHSRSARAAAWGAGLGNGLASLVFFGLGFAVIASAQAANPGTAAADVDVLGTLLAFPAAGLALAILAIDEIDESFANLYSATVSAQNAFPRVDRRVIAAGLGVLCTVLALAIDINDLFSWLYFLGGLFVPLFCTLLASYWIRRRHGQPWDISAAAPGRPIMLIPWLVGAAVYQVIHPGSLGWWSEWWLDLQRAIGLDSITKWLSASVLSGLVAAGLAVALEGRKDRRLGRERPA